MKATTCKLCGSVFEVKTGAELRAMRRAKGVSLEAVGKAMRPEKLTRSALSLLELGEVFITPSIAARYERALAVAVPRRKARPARRRQTEQPEEICKHGVSTVRVCLDCVRESVGAGEPEEAS